MQDIGVGQKEQAGLPGERLEHRQPIGLHARQNGIPGIRNFFDCCSRAAMGLKGPQKGCRRDAACFKGIEQVSLRVLVIDLIKITRAQCLKSPNWRIVIDVIQHSTKIQYNSLRQALGKL